MSRYPRFQYLAINCTDSVVPHVFDALQPPGKYYVVPVPCERLLSIPLDMQFNGLVVCGQVSPTCRGIIQSWFMFYGQNHFPRDFRRMLVVDSEGARHVSLADFLNDEPLLRRVLVLGASPRKSPHLRQAIVRSLFKPTDVVHYHFVDRQKSEFKTDIREPHWIYSTNTQGESLHTMRFDLVIQDDCRAWQRATMEGIFTLLSPDGILATECPLSTDRPTLQLPVGKTTLTVTLQTPRDVADILKSLRPAHIASGGTMLILGGTNVGEASAAYLVRGYKTFVWNQSSDVVVEGDNGTGVTGILADFNDLDAWKRLGKHAFDVIVFDYSSSKFWDDHSIPLLDVIMERVSAKGAFYVEVSQGVRTLPGIDSAREAIVNLPDKYYLTKVVGMPFRRPDHNYGESDYFYRITHRSNQAVFSLHSHSHHEPDGRASPT